MKYLILLLLINTAQAHPIEECTNAPERLKLILKGQREAITELRGSLDECRASLPQDVNGPIVGGKAFTAYYPAVLPVGVKLIKYCANLQYEYTDGSGKASNTDRHCTTAF